MPILHWMGRLLLAVLLLGVALVAAVYARIEWQSSRRVPLPAPVALTITTDSATVAKGAHVANAVAGCVHCHGADLGGAVIVDEPMVLRLAAPNLTSGRGGVLSQYNDIALEAAVRHGVGADGRRLRIMPAQEFAGLADDQVAALIAYVRTRPAVDRVVPPFGLGPVGRALVVAGELKLFPYDRIDHSKRAPAVAPVGLTVEHGAYLVKGCVGCHGPQLSGGPIGGAPPDWPPSANITPTGIGTWSEADFIKTMRTGVNPSGRQLHDAMPWKQFGGMTDDELIALRRYLATVAPRAPGLR